MDATRYAGYSLSLRVNPQGMRRYAWWTSTQGILVVGDGWASEVLPGPYEPQAAGGPAGAAAAGPAAPDATELFITNSVSLALGPDDTPWVAHVRHDCFAACTGTARVSHRTGTGWSTEDLGEAYSRPAIEVGADGRVHVSYSSAAFRMRYWVRAAAGGWTEEPVADTYGEPSLRLDASDTPHLAWGHGGRIWYAVRENGAWQPQVVDSGGVTGASLALSASGEPRVAYLATGSGVAKGLWYAEPGPGGWTRAPVVPALGSAQPLALAVDPAGDPFIAFNDQNGLDLRYASRKQGSWSVDDVDTFGNTGYWPSVAFDPAGHPLVAYQADETIGVRLATGPVIVGVEDAPRPAAFALRALGGIARCGRPLALELTSPAATRASLRIVDVAGRAVAELREHEVPAGVSTLRWEAALSLPGVYFVQARAAGGASFATRVPVTR